MKRKNLYVIRNLLNECFKAKYKEGINLPLSYAIVKNLKKVENEIELIEKVRPQEPKEFTEKKLNYLKSIAVKDENGEPIWEVPNEKYKYTVSNEEINKAVTKIKNAFPEYEKQILDFVKFLDEEIKEIEFVKVTLKALPENIDLNLLYSLDFMVD